MAEQIVAVLTATDNTAPAMRSAAKNAQNYAKATNKVNNQLRLMRGGFGQVGHQIQDIAVQLQMGTNALIVFGQQGSQIASLFGPQGALIGALLAVGAAIAVGLSGDVKKGANKIDELRQEIEALVNETIEYNEVFADFLKLSRLDKSERQKKNMAGLSEEFVKASEKLERLKILQLGSQEVQRKAAAGMSVNTGSLKDYSQSLYDTTLEVSRLKAEMVKLAIEMTGIEGSNWKDASDERLKASRAESANMMSGFDAMVEKYNKEKEISELQVASRRAATKQLFSINDAEIENLSAARDAKQELYAEGIEQLEKDLAARRAASANLIENANLELNAIVAAEKKKQEAVQLTKQTWSESLSFMGSATGSIMGMLDEQSGAYKALFVVQQATQIAQAIMSAHTAAANALAFIPPPMNAAVSATMLAMGYAQAAAIAGQTLASFEGGGLTGGGVRSGGMDGKGGMLAMLHPNEKITDLEKSGNASQPVNVTLNIQANDSRGFDELLAKRRGMIIEMVNKAVNNSGRRSLT